MVIAVAVVLFRGFALLLVALASADKVVLHLAIVSIGAVNRVSRVRVHRFVTFQRGRDK